MENTSPGLKILTAGREEKRNISGVLSLKEREKSDARIGDTIRHREKSKPSIILGRLYSAR